MPRTKFGAGKSPRTSKPEGAPPRKSGVKFKANKLKNTTSRANKTSGRGRIKAAGGTSR